jgi:DNA-directed RNA polymerase subunit RPC12/RpoP
MSKPENRECQKCGSKTMWHNQGISSKTNKPYNVYKCTQCGEPEWVKDDKEPKDSREVKSNGKLEAYKDNPPQGALQNTMDSINENLKAIMLKLNDIEEKLNSEIGTE